MLGTIVPEWYEPIMVKSKKGTDHLRMHMDLFSLNHYVRRERCQFATLLEAVADIVADEAQYFTV